MICLCASRSSSSACAPPFDLFVQRRWRRDEPWGSAPEILDLLDQPGHLDRLGSLEHMAEVGECSGLRGSVQLGHARGNDIAHQTGFESRKIDARSFNSLNRVFNSCFRRFRSLFISFRLSLHLQLDSRGDLQNPQDLHLQPGSRLVSVLPALSRSAFSSSPLAAAVARDLLLRT